MEFESPEKSHEEIIQSAQSLSELHDLIGQHKISLEGSQQPFTTEMLQAYIKQVQKGEIDPNVDLPTRTAGFREKVLELWAKEKDQK